MKIDGLKTKKKKKKQKQNKQTNKNNNILNGGRIKNNFFLSF